MIKLFINHLCTQPIKGKVNVFLRKGLNVIRAEKVGSNEDSGPRNSLGKSTFVKLLDYGLARTQFLQNNDKIAKRELKEHYLILEVLINEKKYTLKRKLVDNSESFVFEGWVAKDILEGNHVKKITGPKFNDYKAFLEEKLLMHYNFSGEEKLLSVRQFLPLVMRDQINGFSDIYKPFGRSEGQQLARLRAEFFSGLSTAKKLELEKELIEVEEKRKQALQDYNIITKYIKKKFQYNINDLEEGSKNLEIEISKVKESIKTLRGMLLVESEDKKQIQNNMAEIEEEIANLNRKISSNNSRIHNYEATINEIMKELETFNLYSYAASLFDNFKQEICPVCLSPIKDKHDRKNSCEQIEKEIDINKEKTVSIIKKILNNEVSDLKSAIDNLRSKNKIFEEEIHTYKKNIIEYKVQLSNNNNKIIEKLNKDEEELMDLTTKKGELISFQKAQYDIEEYKKCWMYYKDRKKDINKELETANLEVEKNRKKLIVTYDKVVRYLYNDSRKGILRFSPKAGNIEVDLAYMNEEESIDNGAAAQIVKVIAFDLALLELSLSNQTYHPKFLVHDSPNVNDIDIDVYHRIFSYIINLEKKQLKENNKVDFQYIITTITMPENEVKKEHVRLELDSKGEGGKLFGFTF
ncbi:hypothetical protein LSG23_03460 [Bacillus velezensis]|uniref:DUF2326 domain-containing protein n=1 Tax=Bacillus velezensis TaxID=492670 RepID=UPI000987F53E|nr:DUF2326 domain-containing protein [Bacillus velezensis]AQS43104.1 hypothetical protein BVH55_03930 [Bacillus velezensis]WNR80537.1 hypothetical protein RP314_16880 [Bacillus velezensis]